MIKITKENISEIQKLKVGGNVIVWNRICEIGNCLNCKSNFIRNIKTKTSRQRKNSIIMIRPNNSKTCNPKCRRAYKNSH